MCRQLKAKCDELKPCKSCKEKKVECKYRETVPKQYVLVYRLSGGCRIADKTIQTRQSGGRYLGEPDGFEKRLQHVQPSHYETGEEIGTRRACVGSASGNDVVG